MVEPKHKIGILVEQLAKGGAERSAGILSQLLDKMGYEVHVITITDFIEYPYAGTLFNLGLYKNKANDPFNKLQRLQRFKIYLNSNGIQTVLDFRFKQSAVKEWLILKYLYTNKRVIYMVRSSKLEYYFPKQKRLTRRIFKNVFAIVTLTQGIKQKIKRQYNLDTVKVIPNIISIDTTMELALQKKIVSEPYIVAAGRMDQDIKQFDKLIESYAASNLPAQGISLRILGRGELQKEYKQLAFKLGVGENVIFEGFHNNPYPYFKNALFFVHCSKFEGFPMVLLESLACQTPVIAMDCPTGPSEIIEHQKNGLLIEANNFKQLTAAIDKLYNSPHLREQMSQYAHSSIKKFTYKNIFVQWQALLNGNDE